LSRTDARPDPAADTAATSAIAVSELVHTMSLEGPAEGPLSEAARVRVSPTAIRRPESGRAIETRVASVDGPAAGSD
jgi:hypothetical protein